MKFTVKPFQLAHLDIFQPTPSHKEDIGNLEQQFKQFFTRPGLNNFLGTFMLEGRIIFIAGFFQLAPGVVEIFMFSSIYMHKYPLAIVKELRWWIEHLGREHNLRRMQTWGNEQVGTYRWLETFGFVEEGELKYYLPDGKSVKLWAYYYSGKS